MNSKKPQNIDEYKQWLKEKHGIEISKITKTHYESVTNKIRQDFEKSSYWNQLTTNLREYDDGYKINTGYPLLAEPKSKLVTKPFDSFLFKTFRKNILENKRWPDKPDEGWIVPDNWYYRINDIIRTLIVVKYLDGVEFMVNKVKSFCEQHHVECRDFFEATEEGYYAAHLYMKQEFEIPKINWDTVKINVSIEIQITTQIQEVIRKLLHSYYEKERKKTRKEKDMKWQWNYKSDEFVVNYLGHILHYVEGMIMEIREKQKKEEII